MDSTSGGLVVSATVTSQLVMSPFDESYLHSHNISIEEIKVYKKKCYDRAFY